VFGFYDEKHPSFLGSDICTSRGSSISNNPHLKLVREITF
jgi:hypothetical protein